MRELNSISQPSGDVANLAKGAGITLFGRISGRGTHILGQVALARLLGPETFGLYAIGWTILRIAALVAPLGLEHGVIRYGSQQWHKDPSGLKGVLWQSLGVALLSGLLFGGGLYVAAPWLAQVVFQKPGLLWAIRGFGIALIPATTLRVAAAATRISQRMQYSALAEEFTPPAAHLLLLVIIVYFLGWGLLGAVAAGVLSFALGLLLALYFIRGLFQEIFATRAKFVFGTAELLSFSLPASLAGIFTVLITWITRLMVGYFLPASEVGIYQAASQAAMLFAIILSAFNAIFTPMIASLYHDGYLQRLNELFKVSTKWGLYVSLPLVLVLTVAPKEVLTAVFGWQYQNGAFPMTILVAGQLINVGTGAVGFLLIMTGYQNRWLLLSAGLLIISVALNILLIPRWGLLGAALGTAGSVGGLFTLGLLQVRRSLGFWPYDRRYLKGALATALSLCALILFRGVISSASPLALCGLTITSLVVFGITLILLGLDAEDRLLARLLRERLKNRSGAARDHDR